MSVHHWEVPNEQSGTLAYEVGTRNANTVLRLKDGETQVLAGLITDEDRRTAAKIPGLGDIPLLGHLFSSHKNDGKKSEIVLAITPRIVGSARLPDANEVEYWSGTEASLRNSVFSMKPLGTVAVSTSAAATPVARTGPQARRDVQPAPQPAPATEAVVLSWQGPRQAKPGETISLTLNAQSAQAVSRMGLLVSYDPGVFKALDVTEGDFLKQNNTQTTFTKTIDQASGQIRVDLAGIGPDGTSGTGSVVTLAFEAIAAHPQSQIVVGRLVPGGPGGEELAVSLPAPHVITVTP
jgi:general secretion pathway protein D